MAMHIDRQEFSSSINLMEGLDDLGNLVVFK